MNVINTPRRRSTECSASIINPAQLLACAMLTWRVSFSLGPVLVDGILNRGAPLHQDWRHSQPLQVEALSVALLLGLLREVDVASQRRNAVHNGSCNLWDSLRLGLGVGLVWSCCDDCMRLELNTKLM